ncbi:putative sarcosine oxidase [Macrophomina phaseolina]|uniref:Sarcosine oxidase n=2 Tax=Macrophomina phaseolina TaxID=35725 RepID=A0ABQ8G0J9_9PEZI|nr:putative sarcosine oxidase [Macrophomina phaseolina]
MGNLNRNDPIIIVGAGAFGLSTALHLSQAGYTNITVFEQDSQIPPRQSAANDLNKIVRAEYEDPFYTDLTIKAINAWQTPLFAPYFHRTGFLHCVSGAAPAKAVATLDRFRAAAEASPTIAPYVDDIPSAAAIRHHVWQYSGAALPGWRGYLNRFDGYAHSGAALRGIHAAASARGVRFHLGARVAEVAHAAGAGGSPQRAVGIRTRDGTLHRAAVVVVACGAGAAGLVPAAGAQVVARAWSVAHVELAPGEASALRGLPVTYARDLGFFFEPDPASRLLKLCPMGGGYVNTHPATGVSHAPALEESGFMPREDERKVRELLRQTLPQLAERPLVRKSLCWFADTSDSDFVIDYVPGTGGSVVLLSGDSGHGFKMFPIFGQWVRDLLEARDGTQAVARWRWKEPKEEVKGGDWGGDVSWRIGETREFSEVRPASESKL